MKNLDAESAKGKISADTHSAAAELADKHNSHRVTVTDFAGLGRKFTLRVEHCGYREGLIEALTLAIESKEHLRKHTSDCPSLRGMSGDCCCKCGAFRRKLEKFLEAPDDNG